MCTPIDALCLDIAANVAWETYREAVGSKAMNGDPLPRWNELKADPAKAKIVSAWMQTANAVLALQRDNFGTVENTCSCSCDQH